MVPECLGNTSLRKVYLNSNKFVSHMPSSLCSLIDILALDLSCNALSGSIPHEVSNLRALLVLNLSRNQISGIIPPTIGGLQTLTNLSLAENKLQGPIPDSFKGMISMEFMDLSHNYLFGVIPKSLESLVNLKYLDLSYKLLCGEIPDSGPFQNFTAESFMMNRDLCGKPQFQVQSCKEGHKHIANKVMLLVKCSLPIIVVILVVSCIFFLKHKRDNVNYSIRRDLTNLGTPIRISYYELLRGTNGFDEKYGSKGVVFVKGDVYTYGILLMETFTRKKPTDQMFVEGLSLKH
ncbi:LRR receptor-like serine/threonine-protein kinase EFR [Prosopis cineraria]|uniref:LRR receptor-like serine/threonine-protein kinase EFR n=1 Tax=Prosopis cineraria TaxID=364024 RepID=UPI00240F34E6|nr:LRR receptor-like serine/threonine-protein kinase EFR [Prosopis cineraria]